MSRKFYHQIDGNQKEIVRYLRAAGASVLSLSRMGDGCPDLLICYRGKLALIEIKMPGGKLTEKQEAFIATWGSPVHRVSCLTDAEKVLDGLAVSDMAVYAGGFSLKGKK